MKNKTTSIFLILIAMLSTLISGVSSYYFSIQFEKAYALDSEEQFIRIMNKSNNIELIRRISIESYKNLKNTQKEHVNTYETISRTSFSISFLLFMVVILSIPHKTSNKKLKHD